MMQHEVPLPGCTPEPLMAYLKALGVLRLVSEQKDPEARGRWLDDVFHLRFALDRDALVKFFLEEYEPTPVVAPWGGGSGFFMKDNKAAVEAIQGSKAPRLDAYVGAIRIVKAILKNEKIGDKPKDEQKSRLIRRYRRELPDGAVAWMDAAMVLQQDGQDFAPLLGTGGNDGRLDFTQNFMQRIVLLSLHKTTPAGDDSRAWLNHALYGKPVKLSSARIGQFAPGRAGGPNATQGMEGDSADNPWDFVLMLEGALMLAGAAVRRFGVAESGRFAFPFTVRAIAAGFDSPASKDAAESRGELWLPLWSRPMKASELRYLFGEARADVTGRAARDGTDFARSVAGLGVDRGIAGFARLGFLKRSGKQFLAAPLGRFSVRERSQVDLLRQIDPWRDRFRSACSAKGAPARFGRLLHRIDSTIFDFCRYGGASFFGRTLAALGRAERELANAERFRKDKRLAPVSGLTAAWLAAANDGSPEFAVALALATVHDPEAKIGSLRANLETVDWRKRCRVWAEKDRRVCWNAASLPANLANVLQRRLMDGARAGCGRLPLASPFAVPPGGIAAFLEGDLNDERIEDFLWGIMLVDAPGRTERGSFEPAAPANPPPLAREYALLKLLFLPTPLVSERREGLAFWRLARRGETGIVIRPEPRIIPLLRAGRPGEACRIAAHRLRVSGLPAMPGPRPDGHMRDDDWSECASDRRRAERLAASLLIPISSPSVNRLVHLVCRGPSAAAKSLAVFSEGEPAP